MLMSPTLNYMVEVKFWSLNGDIGYVGLAAYLEFVLVNTFRFVQALKVVHHTTQHMMYWFTCLQSVVPIDFIEP